MRRYKRGQEPIYDNHYNKLLQHSWIINAGIRQSDISFAFRLNSKNGIIGTIEKLDGKDNPDSEIALFEKMLTDINEKFAAFQRLAVNQGYHKPDKWPDDLLTEKLTCEAEIDIRKHECSRLLEMLQVFLDEEKNVRNEKMLSMGPICSTYGEPILKEIDHQAVGVKDGLLIIIESESPYRGMLVADYRQHICKPWIERIGRINDENHLQREKEFKEFGRYTTPSTVGNIPIRREDFPKWPEGIKNFLSDDN